MVVEGEGGGMLVLEQSKSNQLMEYMSAGITQDSSLAAEKAITPTTF